MAGGFYAALAKAFTGLSGVPQVQMRLGFAHLAFVAAVCGTSYIFYELSRVLYSVVYESEKEGRKLIQTLGWLLKQSSLDSVFIPPEFQGLQPDSDGIYTYGRLQDIYYRQCPTETGLWEWSFDRESWQPTSEVVEVRNADAVLDPPNVIFIARLYLEYAARKKGSNHSRATHFPQPVAGAAVTDKEPPAMLCCPISQQLMQVPVVVPSGTTFDLEHISQWIKVSGTDPTSSSALSEDDLYPNLLVREMIERWLKSPGTDVVQLTP